MIRGQGLTIDPVSVSNAGLIEATGGYNLTISSATVDDSAGGTIEAEAGKVLLASAVIVGGTLASQNGNVLQAQNTGVVLDGSGSTVTNNGVILVPGGAALHLQGAIRNTGTIEAPTYGQPGETFLVDTATVTLSGGGEVYMSGRGYTNLDGEYNGGTATLVNVDNLIEAAGTIGNANALAIDNRAGGRIEAIGPAGGETAVVNTGTNSILNAGVIGALNGSDLIVQSATIDQSQGGTLTAGGARVDLQNVIVIGGTLASSNGGEIRTGVGSYDNVLDGTASAVTNTGVILLNNGNQANQGSGLHLQGTIHNSGAIDFPTYSDTVTLFVDSATVTLDGGGQISMGPRGQHQIVGDNSGGTATLDNVDNTIVGTGAIGDGTTDLAVDNEAGGTIEGGNASTLTINTGSNAVVNAGTIAAYGNNMELDIQSIVTNSGTLISAQVGPNFDGGYILVDGGGAIDGGTVLIGNGGQIAFDNSNASSPNVEFTNINNSGGALVLGKPYNFGQPANFTGTVTDFGANDVIAFNDISVAPTNVVFTGDSSGGELYVFGTNAQGGIVDSASVHLVGNYTGSSFKLTDIAAGNNVTLG